MDTQAYPSLAALNAQIASQNSRVSSVADLLAARIDGLVAASLSEDWEQIARIVGEMALSCRGGEHPEIVTEAKHVADALSAPRNPLEVKRGLLRLIGKCGRIPS